MARFFSSSEEYDTALDAEADKLGAYDAARASLGPNPFEQSQAQPVTPNSTKDLSSRATSGQTTLPELKSGNRYGRALPSDSDLETPLPAATVLEQRRNAPVAGTRIGYLAARAALQAPKKSGK